MTASSDYGVSIVESFAPPKNWLPGEDVNKDVYAVNTGNIDAFVKENIQGVLNYTYEDVVVDFGTADTKYVELTLDQVKAIQGQTTEDGFKTYEAGGYLAWTNAVNSTTTTTPASYSVGDTAVDLAQTGFEEVAYPEDNPTSEPMKTFTVKIIDPVSGTTLFAESDSGPLYTLVDGHGDYMVYTDAGKSLVKTDATSSTTTTPVEVGSIYEGRTQDITNPWTPTETGVYVFRRSINPQTATSQGKDIGNPFTYSGYYFVKGEGDNPDKYYKIVLGGDSYPAADRQEVDLGEGKKRVDFVYDIFADSTDIVTNPLDDTQIDQETGEIKTDVGYMFVVEKEVKDQDVTFTMDDPNHRLVAEYTIAYAGDGTYDAKATLARAQVDYENAKGAYDAAKAHYDNAVANRVYAEELAAAEQKLWKALDDFQKAYNEVNNASTGSKKAWEDARDAVNNAAKYTDTGADSSADPAVTKPTEFTDKGIRDLNSDATTNNYNELADGIVALKPVSVGTGATPAGIMPDEVMQAINTPANPVGNPYVAALNDANSDFRKAFDNYSELYREIYGTEMTGASGLYKKVTDELANIKTYSASTLTLDTKKAAEAKQESEKLKSDAETLKKKMAALKKAYANFIDAKKLVTGIDTSDADDTNGMAALTGMVAVADDFYTNADELDKLVKAYVDAEKEYQKDQDALDGKKTDWQTAIATYNSEAGDAQTKYATSLGKLDTLNGTGTAWDSNNRKHEDEDASVETVKYSAVKKGSGEGATDPTDPTIPGTTTSGVYKQLYDYTGTGDLPATINLRDQTTFINGTGHDEIAELKVTDYIGVETQDGTSDVTRTEKEWKALIEDTDGYKDKLAAAKHAYDVATAQNNNGSKLKFYVNLDPDYEDYWQFDTNTDNTANPTFYYRYVLEAGETSHKLIDSVEFDKDVSAGAYKDMTFDLNVGLDSAQVTYDDNQRLYETDAVDGNNAFVLKVTNPTTAFDADTQLTWGTPATT